MGNCLLWGWHTLRKGIPVLGHVDSILRGGKGTGQVGGVWGGVFQPGAWYQIPVPGIFLWGGRSWGAWGSALESCPHGKGKHPNGELHAIRNRRHTVRY